MHTRDNSETPCRLFSFSPFLLFPSSFFTFVLFVFFVVKEIRDEA